MKQFNVLHIQIVGCSPESSCLKLGALSLYFFINPVGAAKIN